MNLKTKLMLSTGITSALLSLFSAVPTSAEVSCTGAGTAAPTSCYCNEATSGLPWKMNCCDPNAPEGPSAASEMMQNYVYNIPKTTGISWCGGTGCATGTPTQGTYTLVSSGPTDVDPYTKCTS